MDNKKELGRGLPKNQNVYIGLVQHKLPSLISVGVVFVVLGVFCVLSLLLAKPTYSEIEKRELAQKPQLTLAGLADGSFSDEAESYYNDTFPLRSFWVTLSSSLDEFKGVRMDDIKLIEAAPSTPSAQDGTVIGKKYADDKKPPVVPDNGEVGEQNGALFIYSGKALSIFGGTPAMAKSYANVINSYADALEGVQVYNIVIPTHIEFALPERYKSVSASQKDNIDIIYGALSDKVKTVDAYSNLQMHNDEYLYFATDHHWTTRGAYYAYEAFCEQAGLDAVPMEKINYKKLNSFLGTLYNQTQDRTLRENPDYVEYPNFTQPMAVYRYVKNQPYTPYESTLMAEYATGTNSYSVFLHGDFPLTQINTEVGNGRKALVVKESFGNAFAPYLVNNFDTVYVVDQRYFQLSLVGFIKENGVTDLIFINNIFAANTPYHIQCIQNLMYQQYVPYVPPAPEPEPLPDESDVPQQPEGEVPNQNPDGETVAPEVPPQLLDEGGEPTEPLPENQTEEQPLSQQPTEDDEN